MNETVTAASAEEVVANFGDSYYVGKTRPELDERRQLGEMLIAASLNRVLEYPVSVKHTRDQKPDFLVTMAGKLIGIEATKIAKPQYEEMAVFQRKNNLGTMHVTPLLAKQSVSLGRKERIQAAFGRPAFYFGTPITELDDSWIEEAEAIVRRKEEIFLREDFNRREQNWLLLWDRLRSSEFDMERRIPRLVNFLTDRWGKRFFDKVIVEQNQFQSFVVLSADGDFSFARRPFANS